MRVVAANAAAFLVCLSERRSGGAGVLIAKGYVISVHEVADSLHPRPTEWGVSEEPPEASSDRRSVSQ